MSTEGTTSGIPAPYKVHVEYCGAWGYYPKFEAFKVELEKVLASASITSQVGRRGSFEITVNGVLFFSKLKMGAFPDMQKASDLLVEYLKTGKLPAEVPVEEGSCCIM